MNGRLFQETNHVQFNSLIDKIRSHQTEVHRNDRNSCRHRNNLYTKLFLLSLSTSQQLAVATTKQASPRSWSHIHRTRRDNNSKAFDVVVVRRHPMKGYHDQRRPAVGHITMIMVPELTWRACRNAPPSNYVAIDHPDIWR